MKMFRRRTIYYWIGVVPLIAAAWIGCSDETITGPVTGNEPPPSVVDLETEGPASVDQLVVKSPGVRSLALQWVAPGADGWDGIATQYDIRYSTSPITEATWDQLLPIAKMPVPVAGREVQTCRATLLEPATKYYFAMKVSDGHSNTSTLSNVAYGTTLQEHQPPSAVNDLTVTDIGGGQFMLEWTASGDDGILGTAATYDVRYRRFGVITDENWRGATQLTGVPVPKAPGEKEQLIVTLDVPQSNHSFALKVGDEVTNWSPLSNPALALGTSQFLWSYPENVNEGDALTVVFRAPGDEHIQVEISYSLGLCGTGDVTLFEGTPESGMYTLTYDFYDPETNEYRDHKWYQVSFCINGERQALSRVSFGLSE